MGTYEVLVRATVTRYGAVEVEAESAAEAKAKARDMSINDLNDQEAFALSGGGITKITAPKVKQL